MVLDTSALVASCLGRGGAWAIRTLWESGHLVLVVSEPILREYDATLLRKGIDAETVGRILRACADPRFVIRVAAAGPTPRSTRSPDPDDNWFLDAAEDGDATAIISNDRPGLLALGIHRGVRILGPADFLSVYREYLLPFLGA